MRGGGACVSALTLTRLASELSVLLLLLPWPLGSWSSWLEEGWEGALPWQQCEEFLFRTAYLRAVEPGFLGRCCAVMFGLLAMKFPLDKSLR